MDVAGELVFQEGALLVDQQFRVTVVAHGDGHVHPGTARDQVGAEHHAAVRLAVDAFGADDFGQHQPRRMTIAEAETDRVAQRERVFARHEFQPSTGFQQRLKFRDETGAVSRVRLQRTLPMLGADDESRVREQQLRRTSFLPRCQQAAGVVEVEMAEHHHVDVLVREAGRAQRIQQHVAVFLHAEACAQLRLEERADAGLEQHRLAVERLRQQRAAGQLDAVLRIGRRPFFPHGARRVAEHRAAIEFLGIAQQRPEFHGPDSTPLSATGPTRRPWRRRPDCAGRCPPSGCWWPCPTPPSAGCPRHGWNRDRPVRRCPAP